MAYNDDMSSNPLTILSTIEAYLDAISLSRSDNTARTYRNAMAMFVEVLGFHKIEAQKTDLNQLKEDTVIWMANALKDFSPATEQVYLTATVGLFEYIAGENLAPVNLPRVRLLIKQRARRPGIRLPQFPKNDIETIVSYAQTMHNTEARDQNEKLIAYRDRAFLLTLADTGLRVHEACKLRRGDVDWLESRAIIIGKGNKEAVTRFSKRSLQACKDYLAQRALLDSNSGRPLGSLPLFARHDRGAGNKVKPISTTTGREIVNQAVRQAIGPEALGTITPHSFRHYFVTTVLVSSGNLKLAQELARHTNIAVTQRYSHLSDDELDQKYQEIFD